MFPPGLLPRTSIPAANKLSVYAESPLAGIWNESTVGGKWSAEPKFCGYEGIIVTGKAEKPFYLHNTPEENVYSNALGMEIIPSLF